MTVARPRRIRGAFCEAKESPARTFDRRSFRYKKSGKAWILVGCPSGEWMPRAQRCRVGTRAHKILRPSSGACPIGQKPIRKG